MSWPSPYGLVTPGKLVLVAEDAVWVAAVRRAVSRLAPRQRPLVCEVERFDPQRLTATLIVLEVGASPPEALAAIAKLRRESPSHVIVALLPRIGEPADVVLRSGDWRRWLTTAGASAVVESPCEADKLARLVARAVGGRPEGGGELPVAWHVL